MGTLYFRVHIGLYHSADYILWSFGINVALHVITAVHEQPQQTECGIFISCAIALFPKEPFFFFQSLHVHTIIHLQRNLRLSHVLVVSILSCVPTSKVSLPHFARLAVFVDRFLWDYNGKPLFKDRHRRKMDQ